MQKHLVLLLYCYVCLLADVIVGPNVDVLVRPCIDLVRRSLSTTSLRLLGFRIDSVGNLERLGKLRLKLVNDSRQSGGLQAFKKQTNKQSRQRPGRRRQPYLSHIFSHKLLIFFVKHNCPTVTYAFQHTTQQQYRIRKQIKYRVTPKKCHPQKC